MRTLHLCQADARRLVLHAQGLDGSWRLPRGAAGAAQVVTHLGYVQIDTISVVARAHHHTFWTRQGDHQADHLDQLQRVERQVFEYWDHAACIVPMANYRFYLSRMRACDAPGVWSPGILHRHRALVDEVLARIRAEGALGSSDFTRPEDRKRTGWWDWKPAKKVLEALYNTGRLMVSHRVAFERRYDLPERVLPAGLDTREPDRDERFHFRLDRGLRADGIVVAKDFLRRDDGTVARMLDEQVAAGDMQTCTVDGLDGICYVDPALLTAALRRRRARPTVHILSPFDNSVINRHRLRTLFDFDYTLECYVPEPKRRYGYFCLPVLCGDRFVARLDAKAERRDGVLRVRCLHVEPGCRDFADHLDLFAARLRAFAVFNGCPRIAVDRTSPVKHRAALARAVG